MFVFHCRAFYDQYWLIPIDLLIMEHGKTMMMTFTDSRGCCSSVKWHVVQSSERKCIVCWSVSPSQRFLGFVYTKE